MAEVPLADLGWQPSVPDFRDLFPETPDVRDLLTHIQAPEIPEASVPKRMDLREYFPPAFDRMTAGASVTDACVGLVEYFERRAHGRTESFSRLFLRHTAQRLMSQAGSGVPDLRTAWKALVRCGLPLERHWPNAADDLDRDPDPFLYCFADEYRPLRYVRLDGPNQTGTDVLEILKTFLAAGFPAVMGFPVPSSITTDSDIPYRPTFDSMVGGEAVVAVGYDDRRRTASAGALLIRTSWGREWGDDGYGWLPYVYVEERLAVDIWTLLRPDWLESGEFERPNVVRDRKKSRPRRSRGASRRSS